MKEIDLGISGTQRLKVDDIKAAYVRMLIPLRERMGAGEDGLTAMPFMKGENYNRNTYDGKRFRILFVGRAANGWEIEFGTGSTEEIVNQIFDSAIDMETIGKGKVFDSEGKEIYNYNKSPFFQLCHAVMELFGFGEDWSERMAWTNLYKVSPYKKGNPNNKLIREILPSCASILRREISHLRPTHIVFVTGDWWYKPTGRGLKERAFVNETGIDLYEDTGQLIIGGGISEAFFFRPNVVITKRPERANCARAEQAKAIFDAFAENEKSR